MCTVYRRVIAQVQVQVRRRQQRQVFSRSVYVWLLFNIGFNIMIIFKNQTTIKVVPQSAPPTPASKNGKTLSFPRHCVTSENAGDGCRAIKVLQKMKRTGPKIHPRNPITFKAIHPIPNTSQKPWWMGINNFFRATCGMFDISSGMG